jgi:hypothetical protein
MKHTEQLQQRAPGGPRPGEIFVTGGSEPKDNGGRKCCGGGDSSNNKS